MRCSNHDGLGLFCYGLELKALRRQPLDVDVDLDGTGSGARAQCRNDTSVKTLARARLEARCVLRVAVADAGQCRGAEGPHRHDTVGALVVNRRSCGLDESSAGAR